MDPVRNSRLSGSEPLLPRLQQRLVIPGGEPHQDRPRQAGGQVPQGGQGLEHVDAADRQEQSRSRQGVEPRPVQQLQSLEGRGGGEDQNGGGQKGQGPGKVQKQHRPHTGPQQSGRSPPPPVRRRPHTPGRRGRSPPASGWQSAPLSEKIGSPRPEAGRPAAGLGSTPCTPQLVPPVFRREVHGLIGFFHHFTAPDEKIPSGKAGGPFPGRTGGQGEVDFSAGVWYHKPTDFLTGKDGPP